MPSASYGGTDNHILRSGIARQQHPVCRQQRHVQRYALLRAQLLQPHRLPLAPYLSGAVSLKLAYRRTRVICWQLQHRRLFFEYLEPVLLLGFVCLTPHLFPQPYRVILIVNLKRRQVLPRVQTRKFVNEYIYRHAIRDDVVHIQKQHVPPLSYADQPRTQERCYA
ncbi:hypothetical protein D3C77_466860 [compost metagenome]